MTLSGGHIACLQRTEDLPTATRENDFNSPLWLPPWPTFDASVSAALPTAEFGQPIADEAATLSHILGHNLCLDVFGAHSDGELAASRRSPSSRAALNFHGEAGNVGVVGGGCEQNNTHLIKLALCGTPGHVARGRGPDG